MRSIHFFFEHLKEKRGFLVSITAILFLLMLSAFFPFTAHAEDIDPGSEVTEGSEGSEEESSSETETEEPPEDPPTVPVYPSNVTATGQNKSIKITWSAVDNAEKYRVYRMSSNIQTGANAENNIAEVNAGTTSFTDTSVKDGIIYEYYVTAVNAAGESIRDPYLRGAYAWTSNIIPAVYGVRFTDINPYGFTISGNVVSSAGLSYVRIPVWTDNKGQDDLIWYDASVSGNSFSLYVQTSSHNYETGKYICHIYATDKNNVTESYAALVIVPDGIAHLSNPCITAMHAGSYELALIYEAPAGISSVEVATYTKKEGKTGARMSSASVDSENNIIRVSISAKDHGNYIGDYYTTVYLTDQNGNQDSHTFTVNFSGKEEVLNQVTTINCASGDSTLVESKGNFMLIDAGVLEGSADRVVQVLKEHNANDLTVVLTHPHSDHIEGLRLVADKFKIKEVYWQNVVSDYWFDNYIREQLLSLLKSKNIPVFAVPKTGTVFYIGSLTASVIGPQRYYRLGEDGATNNNSLYIKIEGAGKSILIAGDSQKLSEEDMLKAGVNLKADVLKVSHHGESTSSTDAFVKAVSPRFAFISGNGADTNVVNRLKSSGAAVYATKDSGSLCYAFFKGGKEIFMSHGDADKNSSLKPTLITYGDVNNDAKWDVVDVSYMYSHILNKNRLSGNNFTAADIDGNEKVDIVDVSYLYSYILQKSATVPQR